ncbi:MAG: hypothetical protein ACRD3W_00075 [Terriglobales bacterium]
MAGELHDNAEARAFTPRGVDSSRLQQTNQDMLGGRHLFTSGKNIASEPDFLDFGNHASIYGKDNLIAQGMDQHQSGIPESVRQQLNGYAESLKREGLIDEMGNWHFQNPRLKPGQDIAGKLKEMLWNTFNPSSGKMAENNAEFLYQFLTGTGRTIQEHTDKNDPMLKDFMHSPGASAIRKQFAQQGFPASTDKLGFGTWKAFEETIAPEVHQVTPTGLPVWTNFKDWWSVAAQVGGFGHPPKDSKTPWATASAIRTDADGKPDPKGNFVQFQVINVAGAYSFNLHGVSDRPLGATGPERSIIQTFQWLEPIKAKE